MRHVTITAILIPNHTVYCTRMHSRINLRQSATSRKDSCQADPRRMGAISATDGKFEGKSAIGGHPQFGIGCALSAVALTACMGANPCYADPPQAAQAAITVEVKKGTQISGLGMSPTLFLTAKPATYNVTYSSTKELVSLADFPVNYILGKESDLLIPADEYPQLKDILDGTDVVISARLDKDGDPSTRDPEDLVGRGVAAWDQACSCRTKGTVVLQGRGAFGKFVTNRK